MGRVSGKVAIVTGAGSGQGAAEAYLLAQEGAKVIATDIDYGSVRKVVGEINRQNPGAGLALMHDVSLKEDWKKVIKTGVEAFGSITILANNTSIPTSTSCDQASQKKLIKTKNIDAWSQFVGIETIVPVMKRAGVGSIVNVAPLEVLNACGHFDTSAASEHTANAFFRMVAAELSPFNIRVNAIAHGVVKTLVAEDDSSVGNPEKDASDSRSISFSGRANDVVQLVLYLASDEASSMTGTLHVINSGDYCVSDSVRSIIK